MTDASRPDPDGAADGLAVAIIGLGLHLPGADGPVAFWRNLAGGVRSIRRLGREELLAAGESPARIDRPDYVPFAADLPGWAGFDPAFWGLSPKDAAVMDPQHRHFLEAAWEALEDAGVDPDRFAGRIGTFAGSGEARWWHAHVLANRDLVESTGEFLLRHTGNDKDFLATRLAHILDLRGPAITVQTACSTSLVATHYACQSLLLGECDLALAGGATLELPQPRGYLFREGEILSPDGECHAFDHRAAGTVFGSGAAVAVLRRLEDALRDGDPVYAVIRGSAVNNDGARKAGYLAPSVDGQADCVAEALRVAGLPADAVSYVECHGTGTYLGDPIEVAALTDAFRRTTARTGFCRIGSVKTNIGHLDTAAGTASLAKAALALHHRAIPPSLGYEAPNPAIPFDETPFRVADRLLPWDGPEPRRAGVNSLGVGGTNAHLILEEAPPPPPSEEPAFPFALLALSARTRPALEAASRRLAAHLRAHPGERLADVAWTLQQGRRAFAHRRVLVAGTHEEAAALLDNPDPRRVWTHEAIPSPEAVFMFPGGGAQYPGMARDLYETEPEFRDWADRGLAHLAALGDDPRPHWLPAPGGEEEAARALLAPSVQLPLLLIVEYALARLWMSWGVRPAALIGHSMGENTAAAVAGILSFEDAIALVRLRGRLFDSLPEGGMLSVALPPEALRERLGDDLDLAVVNGPALSVASGPRAALDALAQRLAAEGVEFQPIPIRVAAHSRMLEPILQPFGDFLRGVRLAPPQIPVVSNRTGRLLTAAEATDPDYWVGHLRGTILFSEGIRTLAAGNPRRLFLEVGPGRTLASLAAGTGAVSPNQTIGSLRHRDDPVPDDAYFQAQLGRVWAAGGTFDWDQHWGGARRRKLRLPTYPWERADYIVRPTAPAPTEEEAPRSDDPALWAWAPRWTPRYAPCAADITGDLSDTAPESWLVLADDTGLADRVAARLRGAGHAVVLARPGDRFAWLSEEEALIPPEGGRDGYDRLLGDLRDRGRMPARILHLWLVTRGTAHRPGSSFFHRVQEGGFWSLLFLAQAWAETTDAPLRLVCATTGALQTRAEPLPHPEKATILGPLGVIPREFPGATAALLDLDPDAPPGDRAAALLEEALAEPQSTVAAIRGGRRLERGWARVPFAADPPPLRRDGPVLVTGGFGGIGLALATALAEGWDAPLALLARTPLPPRAEWDGILRRENTATARRIRAVLDLEARGVRVLPLAADVANIEEMREAIARAEEAFGPLSGVIHAAGTIDDAPILAKNPLAAEEVLAPKVHGLQVLDELLPDGRLDWMLLCSSTSTATCPAGQADYVAANAYLSAWARSRARGRTRVVALDWGPWRDVGMAAEAMAARRGRPEPEAAPASLPLWDRIGFDADGHRLLLSDWTAPVRWVAHEHRTAAGDAVLPGTGVLELLAEAMEAQGEAMPFAIEGLTFLRPARIPDTGAARLRLTLRRSEAGYDALLESAETRAAPEARAEARLSLLPVPAPAPLDPAAIRARLDDRPTGLSPRPDGSLASPQEAHLRFGPRWHVIREAALGEGEGLARLSVPDAEGMILHPGLLDLATGWAMALIPGYDGAHLWVPLSYARIEVHAPLGTEVLSHVRLVAHTAETARFDATLADPSGRVLLRAEGLTLRRLDGAIAFGAAPAPAAEGPRPLSPAEERLARAIARGLSAADGQEAFRRALAQPLPEVAVSPVPLPALIAEADAAAAAPAAAAGPAFDAPGRAAAEPPEGPVETRLAALWSDLLGTGAVGATDSFFELGGHSLIAVRLFAQIRRIWGADLPISTLFEAPTIRALARLVAEAAPAAAGEAQAAAPAAPPRATRRFTHLVPMHMGEGGPRPPFFLVAGMFGNVLNLRHLAGLLGADRPFFGLQAQGLTGEAPPHDSLVEAAASMIAEMRQVARGGPWLLGGFSGGGITAFEIAHQLAASGEEVGAVILLDTPLPQREALTPRDRALIQWHEIRARGPLGAVRYPFDWALRRARWEVEKRRRARAPEAPAQPAFHDAAIEAAFRRAIAAYPMRRWDGPLTLFRPPLRGRWQTGPDRWIDSQREVVLSDNGWTPWAPRLQVIEVPGDHDSMVLEPHVRVLAARLRRILGAAERTAPRLREAAE
ncbi:type I polyketide synthase [Rubellimicrobium sp. CFH 75288]|uniref:type I polyketide synthase n=1 Tax=Rubellimicrobium sp. CFH 75288 TaxID=2697034 RepID=UPI0014135761|nr:type I polyketide synthase [Rubellimicrobium sp. CFH 75288]NAZ37821.1 KR domain-containing protein [Rubellimicrobium sp. CFH 75288]